MGTFRWWHLTAALDEDEQGITLVEVMIATFILSVALLAMASVGMTSLISLRETRDREQATNAASAALEAARSLDFGALAHDPAADASAIPPEIRSMLDLDAAATCADGEVVIKDSASNDPVPFTAIAGTNDAHTVHTVVTWADGSTDCTVSARGLKRVTTLVTWTDRGRLLSVRNETLVAPAGRGLPVPRFEVRPPESELHFTPGQLSSDTTKCIPHLLRNLGAADTYSWELMGVEGAGNAPLKTSSSSWRTPNGRFEVTAYIEHPAVDPPRGDAQPPSSALMVDDDGDGLPDSDVRIENGERATLTVCYQTKLSEDEEFADIVTEIEVVSRFDKRRTETIRHTLSRRAPETLLHLQDRDDTQDHPRGVTGSGNQTVYPPFVMTQLAADGAGTEDRSQHLGDTLLDWSTDIGSPSRPGLRLLRDPGTGGSNPQRQQANWRYQFPATTTLLSGTATLTLYVASDSALAGDTAAYADGATVPLRLRVALDAIDESEQNNNRIWPAAGPIVTDIVYNESGIGWGEPRVVALPITAEQVRTFAAGDRLRVRVTCLGTSAQNCNLGYDAVSHPSRLRVGLE